MRRRLGSVTLAVAAALVVAAPAQAAKDPLNGFRVKPTAENKRQLAEAGFDLTEGDRGRYIEIYATGKQARALRADGVSTTKITNFRPRGVPADYTGSDAALGRLDALRRGGRRREGAVRGAVRPRRRRVVRQEGEHRHTHLGRRIWALKVTKNADTEADNTKPAVLYNAQQHAREWLAGETCRRTLDFFVDNYGNTGTALDSQGNPIAGITAEEVTQLVDTRELWFSCISNPDGFEYTFTEGNRLWRKNMADNDGDGVRGEAEDGVDPNRNFVNNWGLDNEGSSDDPTTETFRGTGPASEPETKAMHGLWDRVDFVFQKNDHTASELLLYPLGYQQYTTTPDNGLLEALAGNDDESAIADRVWNDEDETWDLQDNPLDDDTSVTASTPTSGPSCTSPTATRSRTPTTTASSGSRPRAPCRPTGTSPASSSRTTRTTSRRSSSATCCSRSTSRSRPRPGRAVLAPRQRRAGLLRRGVRRSYGDPQAVEVSAKRSLGDVRPRYRINDGAVAAGPDQGAARGRALRQRGGHRLPAPARRGEGDAAR